MYILFDLKKKILKLYDRKIIMDKLYFLEAEVPTTAILKEHLKDSSEEIISFFEKYGEIKGIAEIKKTISKIDYKIPLYDEYTRNIYIIVREEVYKRVIKQYFRFPDEVMLKKFISKSEQLSKIIKQNNTTLIEDIKNLSEFEEPLGYLAHKQISQEREYRKLQLMIKFLGQFNLDILKNTYVKVFYYFSNEVGKNITTCMRPSFQPYFQHLKPYYTRSELINLALNMEVIEPSDKIFDQKDIDKLCKIIRKNDIKSDTIMAHQQYIIKNNGIVFSNRMFLYG